MNPIKPPTSQKKQNVLMGQLPAIKENTNDTRIDGKDIPLHTIRGVHLESGLFAIVFGLAADRPEDGDAIRCYFAVDTFVLSCWSSTAGLWKSTTLT